MGGAVVIGVIAGVYPCVRAARLTPTQALVVAVGYFVLAATSRSHSGARSMPLVIERESFWSPPRARLMPSSLRIRRTTEPYGLRLAGEADFSNRLALASALDAVAEQQPEPAVPILVNVADLCFLDAGTAALLGRLALRAPAGVHITAPQPAVERVLDHLGVLQLSKTRLTRAASTIDSPGTEMPA